MITIVASYPRVEKPSPEDVVRHALRDSEAKFVLVKRGDECFLSFPHVDNVYHSQSASYLMGAYSAEFVSAGTIAITQNGNNLKIGDRLWFQSRSCEREFGHSTTEHMTDELTRETLALIHSYLSDAKP